MTTAGPVGSWPWPGETATERARRIANALLEQLPDDARSAAVNAARAFGETWLGESLVIHTPDQDITGMEAAQLVAVSEDVIRRWACTAHPDHPDRPLLPRFGWRGRRRTYLVRDVLDAAGAVRRHREARHTRHS